MKIQMLIKQIHIYFIICIMIIFTSVSSGQKNMLKDIFKDHFYLGTALNDNQILGKEPKALAIMKKHFNSVTAENAMKWSYLQEKQGEYNFGLADQFTLLGEENKMFIIGHTLVWHYQTPSWVFLDDTQKVIDRENLLQRMRDHIFTVVGRYKGRVHGWDVINEAVNDQGQLRQSKWLEIIGEDYLAKAFEYAHEADPDAELYYNDYSLYLPAKRDGVVRLIHTLQSRGVQVDGIGMQGHLGLDFPEKLSDLEASIVAFSELGVKVMITELDVNVLPFPDKQRGADLSLNFELQKELNPYPEFFPEQMQEKLARRYAEFFKIFYQHRDKISRVTIWGIHDGQSWLNYWPIKGRTNYPLLFDRKYKPKPAFDAVVKIIQSKK
jgi:endo-1,4-beta-xylanase